MLNWAFVRPTTTTPMPTFIERIGAEGIRRLKAEMYCEDVRFKYSPNATFG